MYLEAERAKAAYEDHDVVHINAHPRNFDWYEKPEARRIAPMVGRGLQVDREPEAARQSRDWDGFAAIILMPHGEVVRSEERLIEGSWSYVYPLSLFVRMPTVFKPFEFDRFPSTFDGVTERQAILSRRDEHPTYFPPDQDQKDLYAGDGPMLDWRKITEAVGCVWRDNYLPYGYLPRRGHPVEFEFMHGFAEPAALHRHENLRQSMLIDGTYAFKSFDNVLLLTSEQVERAVRWHFMPETVKLS